MTLLAAKLKFELKEESHMEISLDDAYSLKSPAENRALYAKWARTYESEFVINEGYEHPKVISELFDNLTPQVRSVIDIGTGTGLVGHYLHQLRPKILIDGVDISPEMLAEARKKGVYRNLYERDLTEPIKGMDAPYDALICIGIFTHGHLGPEVLANLIPIIRSGGYFVIGINAKFFKSENFEAKFEELHEVALITKPIFQEIKVYKEGSAHENSLNVVAIFQKS